MLKESNYQDDITVLNMYRLKAEFQNTLTKEN